MSIIELKNMGKTFATAAGAVTALEDINLSIEEGEIFGIIGLSGAGKSTLVRCINYLEVPTSGTVFFREQNLGTLSDRDLRKARSKMGMIFQQFNLLSQRNVLKNVTFPLELTVTPISRLIFLRRSRICFVVFGSSALVASSHRITFGSLARALAMATRCFCPPESCAG